ncbi:unnamed protein product [Ceutorhynchus assimilis]|uniref:Fatty acyl-CoA reductase n=1 Tax=Ceutorhynchus assimilis TaxID=467358 RepID=A0A9N9MMS2_9CUCU|nr:unnamed protein product [Ceutorhynchus assimilis]
MLLNNLQKTRLFIPANFTMSDIQNFYKEKNVCLTGGTGFLGKLIIQKLLRTTNVKTIYVIIRPKRGLNIQERMERLLENEIFSDVRSNFSKIKALAGDLCKSNLGLSKEDKETLETRAHIVFHCGASVSFISNLRETIFSNVKSTREVLKIAKNCRNLLSFVYVSTAYSNCTEKIIEETFYDPPISPELLINICEELDGEMLERITKGLVAPWPNNYTFSKAVSEKLIYDAKESLPIGLFRPSIITSTVEEPIEGWTDNLNGPNGLIFSINVGLLRIIHCDSSVKLDFVPADMVVNAILCMAWEVNQRWIDTDVHEPLIMNFSGAKSEIYVSLSKLRKSTTIKNGIGYPMCFLVYNKIIFYILNILLHIIPNYIIDKIAVLLNKTPRVVKLHLKITRACNALFYFMCNEFEIKSSNVMILWNKLNKSDQELFNFDVERINGKDYFKSLSKGLKAYFGKENSSDIKQQREKLHTVKSTYYGIIGSILILSLYVLIILF